MARLRRGQKKKFPTINTKCYFINTKDSIERRKKTERNLRRAKVKAKRWEGTTSQGITPKGNLNEREIATIHSHKSILQHALDNGFESVFILEDDIDFAPDFLYKLDLCLKELPENWDGLHLGGESPNNCLVNYSPLLNRSIKTWGGYGYMVNRRAFQRLIDELNKEQTQVDTHYTWIMHKMNWFKTKEMLIYHLPGFSIINNEYRDIKNLYKI